MLFVFFCLFGLAALYLWVGSKPTSEELARERAWARAYRAMMAAREQAALDKKAGC